MTNKTIYWLIVTLLILLAISPIAAMACEKSTEFGCKPLIDCVMKVSDIDELSVLKAANK